MFSVSIIFTCMSIVLFRLQKVMPSIFTSYPQISKLGSIKKVSILSANPEIALTVCQKGEANSQKFAVCCSLDWCFKSKVKLQCRSIIKHFSHYDTDLDRHTKNKNLVKVSTSASR